jgi:hypothetical protein
MHSPAAPIPFQVRETWTAACAAALFRRCFRSEPPEYRRHFVAMRPSDELVAGYIHFTEFERGVYLCGGLCIDARLYRRLSPGERAAIAGRGSLSRWLLDEGIAALGHKRAVFAYTGNILSRRDVFALGFVPAAGRFLLVQWHQEPGHSREALVRRVEALGPF